MRILLTNDDGYNSKGIRLLRQSLIDNGHQVWLIGPEKNRSGCGHALTCEEAMKVVEQSPGVFSCSGYPADCVQLGLASMLPQPPEMIISGPNAGANLANDVGSSGTAAAAREGAQSGIPSLAISTLAAEQFDFQATVEFALANLQLFYREWQPGFFWNVNVPNRPTGVALTNFGSRKYKNYASAEHADANTKYYRVTGIQHDAPCSNEYEDLHCVARGLISVTAVELHYRAHRPNLSADALTIPWSKRIIA